MDDVEERARRSRDATLTRSQILAAARSEFAVRGYAATTVRSIATSAGVSPNLITRYFGGKEGLFLAATEVHLQLANAFDGPRESLGARMADSMLSRWTRRDDEDPLLILLRASGERPESAEVLARFLDQESLEPFTQQLRDYGFSEEDAVARGAAVDVFALGVSSRYRVLRDQLGDGTQLREWLAETIQRLVDGP
ncbi:MAG: TetR family transcriptional regulator [Lacisediminihabitans sp.]